jgi:hypothetical protein
MCDVVDLDIENGRLQSSSAPHRRK